jgi:hypothetical protein
MTAVDEGDVSARPGFSGRQQTRHKVPGGGRDIHTPHPSCFYPVPCIASHRSGDGGLPTALLHRLQRGD